MNAAIAFQTHGATARFYKILAAILLRPFIITLVLDYQNDQEEPELISQPQRLLTTNTELLTQNTFCLQAIEPCSVSRPEALWWTRARGIWPLQFMQATVPITSQTAYSQPRDYHAAPIPP